MKNTYTIADVEVTDKFGEDYGHDVKLTLKNPSAVVTFTEVELYNMFPQYALGHIEIWSAKLIGERITF